MTFETQEGGKMSVAQYFKTAHGRPLKFPEILCVEVRQAHFIFYASRVLTDYCRLEQAL
jgi:eukaryotic translation initiation factor 2C